MSNKSSKKAIFGWAMFDFANSSYTTVIITVVYSTIFVKLVVGDSNGADPQYARGNLLWDIGLFISYILCVVTGPIFGAIMDYSAAKKKFLFMSYILTVVTTAAFYVVSPGIAWLGIILLILSNFGFASGESFVASFLPSLGTRDQLGKISGIAWGIGYLGGLMSVIAATAGALGDRSLANFENLRWVGPITAAFFLIAALPTFMFLKEPGNPHKLPVGESFVGVGFRRLRQTLGEVKDFKDLGIFLLSLFFASAGLAVVITYSFRFAAIEFGESWSTDGWEKTMFIITQFTALLGALGFGFLQDKIGAKTTYNLTLGLWIVAVVTIFMNKTIASTFSIKPEQAFLIVGCLAGAGLGATQSSGRAVVGMLSPESKSGEFFGVWGLMTKLASALGVLATGLLQSVIPLNQAILFCAVLFFVGLLISIPVKIERGMQAALKHEGE